MIQKIALSVLLWGVAFSAVAKTSVWKIKSETSEIYLGGTFHLLRQQDFPLPEEFEAAYQDSDTLVFETDIGKLQGPEMQQLVLSKMMLPAGESLTSVLSAETYQLLTDYCGQAGLPIDMLNSFRPSMIVMTISALEMGKLGITQEGVDMYFYKKGKQENKPLLQLETPEEQMDFICSMGEGHEDEFIVQSLKDLEKAKEILLKLLAAWKAGDREALTSDLIDLMKKESPKVYQSLLVDRNNNWMPQIESYFKSKETEFVLVGAGHLVGEDGLLVQLEKLGYEVEQLEVE